MKIGLLLCHVGWSYAVLWLHMAHAHTSRTFVLMPNSSLKLYPFRDWQRYDSFGIELVSRLMDGRISHDTASSCKRHSPRSADVHDGESSRIREEQLKNSLWITVGAAFYSKNLKNIYMYVTLEVIYNFLSVFLSLYTQRTKSINNSSHTHTQTRAHVIDTTYRNIRVGLISP